MKHFGPSMPAYSELAPGIRRIVAPNPSMMTGPGTNTYLFGSSAVAVLDPGPLMHRHVDEIRARAAAPIRWILVTHTHPDHSPAAKLLAQATGALLLGMRAPRGVHQDETFEADRVLADGDTLETDEFVIEAVHTPGHASNHLCYHHRGVNWVFTGDHVIDGSTVVIDPPDGDMKHYLQSLRRVKALRCDAIAPGHGEIINDPDRVIDWIIEHRLKRENSVEAAVAANPGLTARELVPHVYIDVAEKLYGLAERSLLAHLIKLQDDGVASCTAENWTLAGGWPGHDQPR